jgi:hypothetical protein
MLVFWVFCLDKVALIIANLGRFPLGPHLPSLQELEAKLKAMGFQVR